MRLGGKWIPKTGERWIHACCLPGGFFAVDLFRFCSCKDSGEPIEKSFDHLLECLPESFAVFDQVVKRGTTHANPEKDLDD